MKKIVLMTMMTMAAVALFAKDEYKTMKISHDNEWTIVEWGKDYKVTLRTVEGAETVFKKGNHFTLIAIGGTEGDYWSLIETDTHFILVHNVNGKTDTVRSTK